MAEEHKQKESEQVQEFKLEQDNELRFEVENKEKVTLEVCSFFLVNMPSHSCDISYSSSQVWPKCLAQSSSKEEYIRLAEDLK